MENRDCKRLFSNRVHHYVYRFLKMLGLYLVTLIIGHKLCSMLNILNEIILETDLQTFIMCFGQKKTHTKNTTTPKQNSNIKILARAGNQTQNLSHPSRMRYF